MSGLRSAAQPGTPNTPANANSVTAFLPEDSSLYRNDSGRVSAGEIVGLDNSAVQADKGGRKRPRFVA